MAKSPCEAAGEGLLPLIIGETKLTEVVLNHAYIVQPFKGQDSAVGTKLGLDLPKPGRTAGRGKTKLLWFGRDSYLWLGAPVPGAVQDVAAVSNHSDAWACVMLEGPLAEAVLTRLVPIDLRAHAFKRGHTARSLLAHMNASITRTGEEAFQIMVFRSMAKTLVHDLSQAMADVTARTGNL